MNAGLFQNSFICYHKGMFRIKMISEVWGGNYGNRRCGGLTSSTVLGFTYNRHTKQTYCGLNATRTNYRGCLAIF